MIEVKDIIIACQQYICNVYGLSGNSYVTEICAWEKATYNSIIWINKKINNQQNIAESIPARVIVCGPDIAYTPQLAQQNKIIIQSQSPRLLIMKIASLFFRPLIKPQISLTAIINKEAIIGKNCFIGDNCIIGKCQIGDNTIIQHNVTICDNVVIGNNCNINIGSIIGLATAGIERDIDYKLITFPHYAGVKIGNNVNIGAQTMIAQGVLTDTIIEDGSTIDSSCIIGHNTKIKENVYIAASACISGSVTIDDGCTIFSNVRIKEWVHIGEFSCIGMGALVTKNIPAYQLWYGSPAQCKQQLTEKYKPFE